MYTVQIEYYTTTKGPFQVVRETHFNYIKLIKCRFHAYARLHLPVLNQAKTRENGENSSSHIIERCIIGAVRKFLLPQRTITSSHACFKIELKMESLTSQQQI